MSPTASQAGRFPPRRLGLAALTALLTASPLIPSESIAEASAGLFLILLWLLLAAVWATMAVLGSSADVRIGPTLAAVAVLVILVALSGWFNAWEGNPRATINSVWQWIALGIAFFLVRQWVTSPVERRAVCAAMIALAVGLSAFGYYQYFVSQPAAQAYFEQHQEQALREANLPPEAEPHVIELFRSRVQSVEPMATFALTNSFAGFLAPWLVLAAGIGLSLREPFPGRSRAIAGVAISLAVVAGCFFLTKSRTAWLAAACGLALTAYVGVRGGPRLGLKIPLIAGAGLLALFLGAVLIGGVDVEVLSEAPKSVLYRLEYWHATAAMIRDYPAWGVGVGNFQSYYTAYKLPQASETVADPHNFLLEIWATGGSFALLAMIAVFAISAWRLRRPSPQAAEEEAAADGESVEDPRDAAASAYAVYLGALAGVLLAYPMGLAAQFPPDTALLWTGLPVAMLALALLHPWTMYGRLPWRLPAIAVAVMLINFLAAGGIGFASVATSMWLLLAVTLSGGESRQSPIVLTRSLAAAPAVLLAGLLIAFYVTAYRPVLASSSAMAEGTVLAEQGRLAQAEEHLRSAAEADPWSRIPWEVLMSLHARQWIADGSPETKEKFDAARREALARNGRSHGLWRSIGELYLAAYFRRPEGEWLHASIDAHRRAVSLYPAHAPLQVELAWRLKLAGEDAEAVEVAATALELDRRNPHSEKKLSQYAAPAGAEATDLEHLAEKLRKLKGSP